jgi:hypothetical protein
MSIALDTRGDTITIDGEVFDIDRTDVDMGVNYSVEGLPVTAELRYDDMYDSSMALDYCRVGHMIVAHTRYTLGDEQDVPDTEVTCEVCEGTGYRVTFDIESGDETEPKGSMWDEPACAMCDGSGSIDIGIIEWAKREHGATVILPLYFYEHSGISISAGTFGSTPGYPYNDPWDAGMIGVIFDTEQGRNDTGVKAEDIEKALRGEVEEYDRYLRGEVYYYNVEIDDEHYDGCGGFIGTEHAEQSVYEALSGAIQKYVADRDRKRELMTVRGYN